MFSSFIRCFIYWMNYLCGLFMYKKIYLFHLTIHRYEYYHWVVLFVRIALNPILFFQLISHTFNRMNKNMFCYWMSCAITYGKLRWRWWEVIVDVRRILIILIKYVCCVFFLNFNLYYFNVSSTGLCHDDVTDA